MATSAESAHELNVFSVSAISYGQLDPAPIVEGVGFATDLDKFDFTVDMGTTNLEFDSAAYIDFSKIHAVAAGTCSIKASQPGNEEYAPAPVHYAKSNCHRRPN